MQNKASVLLKMFYIISRCTAVSIHLQRAVLKPPRTHSPGQDLNPQMEPKCYYHDTPQFPHYILLSHYQILSTLGFLNYNMIYFFKSARLCTDLAVGLMFSLVNQYSMRDANIWTRLYMSALDSPLYVKALCSCLEVKKFSHSWVIIIWWLHH